MPVGSGAQRKAARTGELRSLAAGRRPADALPVSARAPASLTEPLPGVTSLMKTSRPSAHPSPHGIHHPSSYLREAWALEAELTFYRQLE